ncbi:MAG: hypothetical protein ABI724_13430, partial [Betaproteobacteria bacterium]
MSVLRALLPVLPSPRRFIAGVAVALIAVVLMAAASGDALAQAANRAPNAVAQHLATGFPLTGSHESARCEDCHVGGILKGTPKSCEICHGNGSRINAVTMSSTHAPVVQPCSVCHTTVTFTGTVFDHSGVLPGSCASCHNGSMAKGKPLAHVATSESCDSCHRTVRWAGATFDHGRVRAGTCASCHNGSGAQGAPATHLPTTASCDACHTTIRFAATAMNHNAVAGTACATCHEAGRSWFGVTTVTRPTPAQNANHPASGDCATCHTSTSSFSVATVKPANHLPTVQACTVCHTNAGTFKSGAMNHTGISAGCTTCHAMGSTGIAFTGVTPMPQGAGHIPIAGDCATCHKSTTTFAGPTMSHAGIAGGCATCHEAGKSFAGVNGLKTRPANHIPTGADCGACHKSTTSFAGTAMNHAGISGGCTTCHSAGAVGKAFAGVTPKPQGAAHMATTAQCSNCHTSTASFTSGVIGGKPANHIPSNQTCSACHANTATFKPGVMNHVGIVSGCATCHAASASAIAFVGVTPVPQGAGHIPTSADCATCHKSTTSFGGTAMNHSGIGSGCIGCHAAGASGIAFTGVTPKPQGTGHLPTSADCATCHKSTTSFASAVSSGKPANHLPTTAACTLCHTNPASLVPGVMNHTGITGGCATCHDTGNAFTGVATLVTKPSNHLPTAMACESCHAVGTFTSFAGTPMNHALVGATACATCHESGKSFAGVTIVTRPTPAQNPNHPTNGGCANCHTSTTSFSSGVTGGKPANHIPTAAACAVCHTNPNSLVPGVMNHSGIGSGCTTCHAAGPAGIAFTGVTPMSQGAGHIPAAGDCAACHISTAKFGPGTPMNHAAVSATSCATCHESGKIFTGVTIVTRPTPTQNPNHPATGACATC